MELHGRTQDPPESLDLVMGFVCTVEAEVIKHEPEIEETS